MSYFLVVNYDITDQAMYERYSAAVPGTFPPDAKILRVDHEPNDIEGRSRGTLVVVEFDSQEAAMQWYNSPEYQAIVNLRKDSTDGWFRGAPPFVMPDA